MVKKLRSKTTPILRKVSGISIPENLTGKLFSCFVPVIIRYVLSSAYLLPSTIRCQ